MIDALGTCFRGCYEQGLHVLWDPAKDGNVPSIKCLITENQIQKGKSVARVAQVCFFFLREDKQEIQKESLGLPSSVLLGDLYSEHLSQQFQFQAEHQFACKLQWGTAVHQAKKSKGGFSPGILGFYEALVVTASLGTGNTWKPAGTWLHWTKERWFHFWTPQASRQKALQMFQQDILDQTHPIHWSRQ